MKKYLNGFTFWDTLFSFTIFLSLTLFTLPIFRILLLEFRELEIEQYFTQQLHEHLYHHLYTISTIEDQTDHKIIFQQTEGNMSFAEEGIYIRGEIQWESYRNQEKEIVFYGKPNH